MPVPAPETLVTQVRRLRQEVADHKRAVHFHRRALAGAKAELLEREAECRRLGLALVIVNPQCGEGDIHGPGRPRA